MRPYSAQKMRTPLGKYFNNLCGSEGISTLSRKNGVTIFSSAVVAGSKGCMWEVAATMWEIKASMWDFAATMGIVAGSVWAVTHKNMRLDVFAQVFYRETFIFI